jgi:dehydrogenase/reductase SDR family protein 7B
MKNKVVIITGGTSGIGKACAEVFAKAGSNVVISARHREKLMEVELELKKYSEVKGIVADVSKEEDCKRVVDETVKQFGSIDVLINNAGISMRALVEEVDVDVLRQLMNTNFWGTVYCTKYALPHLLRNKGSVAGISSIAGKKGLPARSGYSASKFAMEGFLESLRTENFKKDLHVLVACPGFTASNIRKASLSKDGSAQGESPREESQMMQPEEVAERIYKAIVKRKRDLVLTSNGKLTVWLDKFFPSFMDKMVYNHLAKESNSPFGK